MDVSEVIEVAVIAVIQISVAPPLLALGFFILFTF